MVKDSGIYPVKSSVSKKFWILISGLLGSFLFLGGLGVKMVFLQFLGVVIGMLILVLAIFLKREIVLPSGFFLYTLFLILFFVHTVIISQDRAKSLEYFSLFFGGGLFWLIFYNLGKEFRPWIDKLIIILGLVFGGLFIYHNYFVEAQIKPRSLYFLSSIYRNHNHLGDFWAVVLIITAFFLARKPKNVLLWALVPLGVYFLAISQSRASYVALAVGAIYLAKVKDWVNKYKIISKIFTLLIVALFLYIGTQKSILFSRPYFVQGILGFVRNPQGVGVGNFGIISSDVANHILGMSGFSTSAHNIVLEVMTGMGVLGVIFVVWLVTILVELSRYKDQKSLIYRAVFFAVTANFFFDATYFIPGMLWLWFGSLGLSQGEKSAT